MANDPNRPPGDGKPIPAEAAYLQAGKTHSPADLAKARALLLPQPGDDHGALYLRFLGLANLGFVDDAFATADRWQAIIGKDYPAILFWPQTASMRRDPRFMQLAARLGLIDFWRASGHWPDFCAQPGLPYDCKTEADKAEPRVPAKG